MRKTRQETPVVPDYEFLDFPDFIPPDRNYGKIETLLLAVERKFRHNLPDASLAVDMLIMNSLSYLAAPLDGHRDRREYRLRQALATITRRDFADLAIVDGDEVVRTAGYMQPYLVERTPEAAGLTHRSGRLGQRIRHADAILAEELAKLDAGAVIPERDPVRIHLALAIVAPNLLDSLLGAVDAALAKRVLHAEVDDLV